MTATSTPGERGRVVVVVVGHLALANQALSADGTPYYATFDDLQAAASGLSAASAEIPRLRHRRRRWRHR